MTLRLFRKSLKKPGASPGTIVYVGDVQDEEIKLELFNYNQTFFSEQQISINELSHINGKPGIKWLNVSGLHEPELIQEIGNQFEIHKLVLEDIVNTHRHAKIEEYDESIYAILKMFYIDSKNEIRVEHINLIFKKNILISFQESTGDVFDPIRKRIREGRKKIRETDSDYLFYALMDAIVDNYFTVIHEIAEKIDILKKSITHNAKNHDLLVLDTLQEEILVIQNSILPLKKIFPELEEYESPLIHESSLLYFRNLNDHIEQIISSINAIKDKLSSMNDYYLSVVSNKTNEVMKTLALVATICVPMTVIAGIYGMNFQYMLNYPHP